jgi:hypothetical protein
MGSLQFDPGAVAFRRSDASLDEGDTAYAIRNCGIQDLYPNTLAAARSHDRVGRFAINVRKAFEIAFGMTGRCSRQPRRGIAGTRATACDAFRFLTESTKAQIVRVFLRPFQATARSIHPQLESVLMPGRNLTAPEHAFSAAFEAEHHMRVVVDLTAGAAAGSSR